MDIWKDCFKSEKMSIEQKYCAGMRESIIAYDGDLGGYADKRYLTEYRVSLGNPEVERIFTTLKKYIEQNYTLARNVYTDDEGCTYNSFVKRGCENV